MRRFLISNPKAFTGEAEVVYDENFRLVRIDVTATNMPLNMVAKFKEHIPANQLMLETFIASTTATMVEASYEVSFDMFWKKYDRKINKKRSEPLWQKLSKVDQVQAYFGIDRYNKFLKQEDWRSKADPEKYLRDRYWENEWK